MGRVLTLIRSKPATILRVWILYLDPFTRLRPVPVNPFIKRVGYGSSPIRSIYNPPRINIYIKLMLNGSFISQWPHTTHFVISYCPTGKITKYLLYTTGIITIFEKYYFVSHMKIV